MRLTRYTDYAMRVLLYLGAQPEKVCSIGEIARAYGISQNHLMKVAHELGKAGYVEGVRGRSGGIRLAQPSTDTHVVLVFVPSTVNTATMAGYGERGKPWREKS